MPHNVRSIIMRRTRTLTPPADLNLPDDYRLRATTFGTGFKFMISLQRRTRFGWWRTITEVIPLRTDHTPEEVVNMTMRRLWATEKAIRQIGS